MFSFINSMTMGDKIKESHKPCAKNMSEIQEGMIFIIVQSN